MQESIVFLLRAVQYRRKESSRSLSHLLMSFLSVGQFNGLFLLRFIHILNSYFDVVWYTNWEGFWLLLYVK